MSTLKNTAPGALSSSLVSTELDSLAAAAESVLSPSYDNTVNRDMFASLTLKLGSYTPGGTLTITVKVYVGDGTNNPDKGSYADTYTVPIAAGASAKVGIIPNVKLYPFAMKFSIVNNGSGALAATGNSMLLRTYNEATV